MSRYNEYGWPPYISVGERRANARRKVAQMRKQGRVIRPIEIQGRKIARSFWGDAWCKHLEKFSDYANRLPRGRSYLRHGAVCHLEISRGLVKAMVIGTRIYNVKIKISKLPKKKWEEVKEQCVGRVGSLLELLQGSLSRSVMEVVTDRDRGLFPLPREIKMGCDCPDWAVMCKHVSAVLYGVGARLDEAPELLFLLRGVDHQELISSRAAIDATIKAGEKTGRRKIDEGELADVFGIDLAEEETVDVIPPEPQKRRRKKPPTALSSPPPSKSKGKKKKKKVRPSGRPAGKKPSRRSAKSGTVTAGEVRRLRKKFQMSRSQFARLLGVSPSAISGWEKKRGALKLQTRPLRGWMKARSLSKKEAQRTVSRLDI
ncbi:MAG: helix-turn-helix domain-containing protein [Candidatus Auribacterota bacterium]|nr:helix-turn-helix domain-containing protein [Candidatus Auribacterota bacterium]